MSKVLQIEINPDIILPDTCDSMPYDLRQHLLIALTNACNVYDCQYEDLRWSVNVDRKTNQPYIRVKKRDA